MRLKRRGIPVSAMKGMEAIKQHDRGQIYRTTMNSLISSLDMATESNRSFKQESNMMDIYI